MSINGREYVQRHALTASCASLDTMFEYKHFLWIEYPADVEYIVMQFKRYEGLKGDKYYMMLRAFRHALSQRGFDVIVASTRTVCDATKKLRHPFEYTRHA